MAADFNFYTYTDDNGGKHKIRLSAASATAQPSAAATGGYTGIPVQSRRSSRSGLLNIRGFRLVRTTGTAPNDKTFSTFLPILLLADYQGASDGDAITVDGVAYTIGKKIPEGNTGY